MKKILFLIPDLRFGGAERVLVNLANNMDKSKYEVYIQTIFDTGIHRERISKHIHYIPGFKWQFRGNSHIIKLIPPKVLYRNIIKGNYDIVVSYLEGTATRIISGCDDPKAKKVAWIHIEFNDKKALKSGSYSFKQAQKQYKQFDKIICVSNTVMDKFKKTIGMDLPPCEVLYNTNESEQIIELAKENIEDVVFDRNIINICSVGKIVPSKGYDRLAHVYKRLNDEGYRIHIYILGVGEQKKEIEQYLEREGLAENFTFLGFRDNPYKYIAACDFYVCSSRKEGFSTAVTESLIVGTPVVSTCCSGAYELLGQNNEFGLVVKNDEDGILAGIKKMLDNDTRHIYKEKAHERGFFFSTQKTVLAVEEMLDSL
jgi:glycosyltransferase involved in cell wall biosynthesis